MREIKFRAWNGRKMFEVDVLAINGVGWDSGGTGVSLAYQPSVKVMQYTGIRVKNDVELYEGDIVPVQGMIHLGWKQGTYRFKGNGKVVYLADTMRFAFIVNTEEHGYQIVCYDKGVRQQYEVIGNIYENPDLLNT